MSANKSFSNKNQRLNWYLDSKFGMFIHWGAYTVAGAEASWPIMAPGLSEAMFVTPSTITEEEYVKLPNKFNPTDFNADQWVSTAKKAGMRYMVITAKHHDGFCMFDAPGTEYKITNTPFGRDVCLELAQACEKHDMKLGFYYSPPDMNHPGYRDTSKPATKNWLGEPKRPEWHKYLEYMESHIRKLLTDYGDVCVMWFDGLCNHDKYDPVRFHKLIHELSPETLINDRLGDGYDFVTPEQFIPKEGIPVKTGRAPTSSGVGTENFFRTVVTLFKIPLIRGWIRKQMRKYSDGTMELTPVRQEKYPSPERFQPWETCMTIGQSWAYNPNETKWKSPKELIRNLCRVTSGGGNYLLNVGPTDKGTFPVEAVERLEALGEWMKVNSDTVYGTLYSPVKPAEWGCAAIKGNLIYLYVFKPSEDGKLHVEDFPGKAKSMSLLTGEKLEFTQSGRVLEIVLPEGGWEDGALVIEAAYTDEDNMLGEYSEPVVPGKSKKKYTADSMKVSAIINGVANGLIALFSYMKAGPIAAVDAGFDVLITIAIITFFTSWLVVSGTRKDIAAQKVAAEPRTETDKKPVRPVLKAFIIMLLCIITLGGVLNAAIYLIAPNGFSNWGYIIFKTLYTAASGALAVLFSTCAVFREK